MAAMAALQPLGSCCSHARQRSASGSLACSSGRPASSGPPLLGRNPRARCVRAAAKASGTADFSISVDPYDMPYASRTVAWEGPSSRLPIFFTAALAFGAVWWFKLQEVRQAKRAARRAMEPWPEIPLQRDNPKAYQLALARTRQAQYVHKAVGLMKAGEPARAMVELGRALDENAICRSKLLDGHQTREELAGLYKLHIKNSEVPPNYSTLLQLQEMLGLGRAEADAIEEEVMRASTAFSI